MPADHVLPLADGVGFPAGAGLPMNYLTAHFALLVRGHLRAGQRVLVHGAAGGVITAVVQLAVALGARVVAVVSNEGRWLSRLHVMAGARRAMIGRPREFDLDEALEPMWVL